MPQVVPSMYLPPAPAPPECLPHPGGTLVLPARVSAPTIRLADQPELLPRLAGTIRVE